MQISASHSKNLIRFLRWGQRNLHLKEVPPPRVFLSFLLLQYENYCCCSIVQAIKISVRKKIRNWYTPVIPALKRLK
jgi:hypothetical protein